MYDHKPCISDNELMAPCGEMPLVQQPAVHGKDGRVMPFTTNQTQQTWTPQGHRGFGGGVAVFDADNLLSKGETATSENISTRSAIPVGRNGSVADFPLHL